MDKRITDYIEGKREEMISLLCELIESPSTDTGPSKAQEIVLRELDCMGFETEAFRGDLQAVMDLPDYCEPDIIYDERAYNVAGRLKDGSGSPSLMLFAHIDTEGALKWGRRDDPYFAERKGGRIYGLGAADDKGGVAMMLEAVKTALHFRPDLGHDLTVLSVFGKHGGAFGTLTALAKGYTADSALYIHPAETGHGFREIKNISLGVVDLKLTVKGKPGIPHDDLDPGTNAGTALAKFMGWMEEYNRDMRESNRFDFGSFSGRPSFLLDVMSVSSGEIYGNTAQEAECQFRCRFFEPLTPASVESGIRELISQRIEEEGDPVSWTLERSGMQATPAMTANGDSFIKLIEDSVTGICGPTEFIHQYHGGSDIRFPMIYGGSRCAGIGPSCGLPERGGAGMEWIEEEDYITGIKILTDIILRY